MVMNESKYEVIDIAHCSRNSFIAVLNSQAMSDHGVGKHTLHFCSGPQHNEIILWGESGKRWVFAELR